MKDIRIVVGQRGWVWVGEYQRSSPDGRNDNYVTLTNAYCIRIWGSQEGLGQLVSGPLKDTVLDPVGTIELHELTVVGTYQCNAKKWAPKLLLNQ